MKCSEFTGELIFVLALGLLADFIFRNDTSFIVTMCKAISKHL